MNKDIKFSVTIPAFKKKFIYEAIDSCLKQTYSNFELIIVNDASPEDVGAVLSEFSDERIRYYVNEKGCGLYNLVDNWNICLSYCTGDYIICMGDDDKLLPNCLEEYAKLIEKYPGLGVYHAMTELIDENSNVFYVQAPRPEFESSLSLLWNKWNGRIQFIGDFCFDVKLLRDTGGFYKLPLAWASDDISAFRAATVAGIANTQEACFQYRVSNLSVTNGTHYREKSNAKLLEKKWFVEYLQTVDPESLLRSDRVYYDLIVKQINKRFFWEIKELMDRDIIMKKSNIVYWLRNKCRYGLSTKICMISFLNSFIK